MTRWMLPAAAAAVIASLVLLYRRRSMRETARAEMSSRSIRALLHKQWPCTTGIPLLKYQQYTHGSWMGSAGHLLASTQFIDELLRRTPAAALRAANTLTAAASGGRQGHIGMLIGALENNPVLAAFGTVRLHSGPRPSPSHSCAHHAIVLEWDTHLQPGTTARAAAACAQYGGVHKLPPDVKDSLARDLAAGLVVAHGTMMHTIKERLLGWNAYDDVRRLSGDMHARAWMQAYFGTIQAQAPQLYSEIQQPSAAKPLLSVFLDVKSAGRDVSPQVLGLLVHGLNAVGVHVWGIGSFVHRQIQERESFPEVQHVAVLPPPGSDDASSHDHACEPTRHVACPAPILFYIVSMPGEIQKGVVTGKIPAGADILFNGSTLLVPSGASGSATATPVAGGHAEQRPSADGDATPRRRWVADAKLLDGLSALVTAHGLKVGLYAQESVMDADAIAALVDAVNGRPETFHYGWSYANLPGTAAADIPVGSGFKLPWWLKPFVGTPWRY